MELKSVVYDGEEYDVVPICPMLGCPSRHLKNDTEVEKKEFWDRVEQIAAESLYGYMQRFGAITRKEEVNEYGDTYIELEVLVLVKRQASAEAVPEDPEQNPSRTCDT